MHKMLKYYTVTRLYVFPLLPCACNLWFCSLWAVDLYIFLIFIPAGDLLSTVVFFALLVLGKLGSDEDNGDS